jgi:proteasome assembly chaperone (PAC2) family protein
LAFDDRVIGAVSAFAFVEEGAALVDVVARFGGSAASSASSGGSGAAVGSASTGNSGAMCLSGMTSGIQRSFSASSVGVEDGESGKMKNPVQ